MSTNEYPALRRIGLWLRRILPRIGFVLLILFVLAAIPWTYFNIKWGRELEAKLAELKAQGMPLSLQEAAPKAVPEAQNAAVLYQEVFGEFLPGEGREGRRIGGTTEPELRKLGDYRKAADPALKGEVCTILSRPEVKRDLQIIRQASTRPYSVFPVNWEDGAGALFPHFNRFRLASQMLSTQALLVASEGRVGEALDWCEVSLRMSEHVAAEPTLIAQLVAIAIQAITFDAVEQILCEQQLEPGVANDFQEYLSRIDLRKTFTDGMIGERALGLGQLETMLQKPRTWPLWKLEKLTYIRYMSRVVEAHRLPYCDAVDEIESANRELKALPFYQGILAKILIPVFARAVHKRGQAEANIALCRVVLALKAYKYERGAYPDSLEKLKETLDWELPEDPFSGKEFIYQREGEGFILYSISQDLEDDGGMPERDEQGKWRGDESDIVWQCRL